MKIADNNFPVQPCHIDTDSLAVGRFGKFEAELAAKVIVVLCKRKGSWQPFTWEEFLGIWRELRPPHSEDEARLCLDLVIDPTATMWWLDRSKQTEPRQDFIIQEDDKHYVTEEFVRRCQEPNVSKFIKKQDFIILPYIDDDD